MLTPPQAACIIYNLPYTKENGEKSLERLKIIGLEPAYLTRGNPYMAFAIATTKIDKEPWKYQRYEKTGKEKPKLKYSYSYRKHFYSTYRKKTGNITWRKSMEQIDR